MIHNVNDFVSLLRTFGYDVTVDINTSRHDTTAFGAFKKTFLTGPEEFDISVEKDGLEWHCQTYTESDAWQWMTDFLQNEVLK